MQTTNRSFPKKISDAVVTQGWCELSLSQVKEAVFPGCAVSANDVKGEVSKRALVMKWHVCFKSKSVILYRANT